MIRMENQAWNSKTTVDTSQGWSGGALVVREGCRNGLYNLVGCFHHDIGRSQRNQEASVDKKNRDCYAQFHLQRQNSNVGIIWSYILRPRYPHPSYTP